MPTVSIPVFSGGLHTNADSEDISKESAVESSNLDIDVLGRIYKRNGRTSVVSALTGKNFSQLIKWSNPDIATPVWVAYSSNTGQIIIYNATFGTPEIVNTWASDIPANIQIIHFGIQLRFANGLLQRPGVLQYLERKFFDDQYTTYNGKYFYDIVTPRLPDVWNYSAITTATTGGTKGAGYYFYKAVPVFDGIQEALLPDSKTSINVSDTSGTSRNDITMKFSTASTNWNPRITAINIYRQKSATNADDNALYKKCLTVSTVSTDEKETATGVTMENKFFDSGALHADFTSNVTYSEFQNYNAFPGIDWGTTTTDPDKRHAEIQFDGSSTVYYVTSFSGGLFTIANQTVPEHTNQGYTYRTYLWNSHDYGESGKWWHGGATMVETGAGSGGQKTFYISGADYKQSEHKGKRIEYPTNKTSVIMENDTKAITILDTTTAGASQALTFGQYLWTYSGTDATLSFTDATLLDKGYHPLASDKYIEVNYTNGSYVGGRLFAGDVRLLAEDNEDHPDWLIFSEVGKPDILPIANYMEIKDSQGGKITGSKRTAGGMAVFLEKGTYRLITPTTDITSWDILESHETIGCVATDSILQVEGSTFFAGQDHAYKLGGNFEPIPITEKIKDIYQGVSNLKNSRFTYDPKKRQILCLFGDEKRYIYTLNLNALKAGAEVWNKLDMGSDTVDLFAVDENMDIFTVKNQT